jgi:uncharacterized protein YehS (DUF1456 family)
MTNNDALKSIRYLLNASELLLINILDLTDYPVSFDEMNAFLKNENDPDYEPCGQEVMAHFLNGLVIFKRGKDLSNPIPPIEIPVTNNVILKKLRIAFELRDTDILALIEKAGLKISPTELSAFFRKSDHRNFRECGDQYLRAVLKYLSSIPKKSPPSSHLIHPKPTSS